MNFRAKMTVQSITDNGYSDIIEMIPVYGGSPEDNSFAKATPSGSLKLQIDNPALKGKLKPGMKFYVDFSQIES